MASSEPSQSSVRVAEPAGPSDAAAVPPPRAAEPCPPGPDPSGPAEPTPTDEVGGPPPEPVRRGAVARAMVLGGVGWVVKPVVQALVVAVMVALLGPLGAHLLARISPTCDNTTGLTPINVAGLLVQGQADVRSSPTAEDRFDPRRAFDGRVTTSWAPYVGNPTEPTTDQSLRLAADSATSPLARLDLTFRSPQEVRLVCVVNGTHIDADSFRHADRAQRVDVALSCDRRPSTVDLKSIGDPQSLDVACWHARSLALSVLTTYPGENIVDPATGKRVTPTGRVAISEVRLYRPAVAGEEGYSRVNTAYDSIRAGLEGWRL